MNRLNTILAVLGLAFVLVLGLGSAASAQKVGNPGTFNFKITNGVMKVKDQSFGFDASQNINFNGTVSSSGAISIPSITFPTYPISASGFNLTVKINVVGPTTGTINPLTGAVSLLLKVWIKIDGVPLGGDCRIASSSSPIMLNTLVTGASGSVSGTPYNPSTGTMRLVNGTFAVPESSSCGVAAGTVNSTVGLPSPSGQNSAVFDITMNPKATRAINPTFSASPATGTAPASINFNSAGTTVSSGPASYQWDFQNDGSFDATGATSSFTYVSGGTKTIKLRVTDSQGDYLETTRTVSISAYPDLAISAASDGDFVYGSQGTYRINLQNQGYAPSGAVSVKTTLPTGLTFVSGSGSGWSCLASGQDVTCSRGTAIPVGGSATELAINVAAGSEAVGSAATTFTVETSGDNQPGNNSVPVTTAVRAVDLTPVYEQVGHALVTGSDPGNLVELRVRNEGDAASSKPVTLSDTFPAGLTPVAASGSGWNCSISEQTVTCTRSDAIAASSVTEPVSIQLDAALDPGSTGAWFDHQPAVSYASDIEPGNDSATARTLVLDGPDLGLTKSHADDFTAGKQESYTLSVKNLGTAPTTLGATVTDHLPDSLQFVSADGGPDWVCGETDGVVTCEHPAEIGAGEPAPDITLNVLVGVDAIPAVTNTATVSTGVDANPDNDESSSDAVVRAIDMTVTKSHEGEIRVGTNEVFRLTAENVGDSPTIAPTTITDVLPAGLTFVSADGGPSWICQESAGTVSCEYAGTISPGDQVPPVEVTTEVGLVAAPAVTNNASVATDSDFNPTNDQTSDGGDVVTVDGSITIGRTGTFNPGQTGTYLINVENAGAIDAPGTLTVETELGTGLTFDSATGNGWSCGESGGMVTCEGQNDLAAHQAAPAIQLRVQIGTDAVPETVTTAWVNVADDRFPNNDEASDTATVLGPDLSVTSTHQGNFRVGGNATFEVTASNAGPGPTTGPVTVTDELPAGFSFVRAQGNGWSCRNSAQIVTCEREDQIAAGTSAPVITIETAVTVAALPAGETSGTVINLVGVQTDLDIEPSNDDSNDPTEVIGTDLEANLDGPAEIGVGGLATYEVTVTSHGAPSTGPIQLRLDLPYGFAPRSFDGSDWNCQQSNRHFDCMSEAAPAAGESVPPLTLTARVGETAPPTAVATASVSANDDVIAGNDLDTFTTTTSAHPDLKGELISATPDGQLVVGSDGLFRGVLRNVGTASTSGTVSAVISLPAGLAFIGVENGSGWSCESSGGSVLCERGTPIPASGTAPLGFRVEVGKTTSASVTTGLRVHADEDLNNENDSVEIETTVGRIDLAIGRSHQSGWTAGAEGTYEVQVSNRGSAATTAAAVVTETLPPGTSFRLASGEGWDCSVSGRRLTCNGPESIEPGATSKFRVTLSLVAGNGGELEATSAVSTPDDIDPVNDVASETISVGPEGSTAPVLPARLVSSKSRATQSGLVLLWVNCPKASGSKCRGRVSLRTAGKIRLGSSRVAIALGSTRYTVAPGRKSAFRIRLKNRGRKALGDLGRVHARATVTTRGADATRRVLTIRKAGR